MRASNSNGSDELSIQVTIVQPPSPPGAPDITEVGGDFVHLQWSKPKDDGGSRILGYWVEKREKGMQAWQRINQVAAHATQLNAPHLIEKREYEFRVFALNRAGMSEPSGSSRSIQVRDPAAVPPPHFVQPLRDVHTIQGKSAQLTCTVTGVENVAWFKGVRELHEHSSKYSFTRDGDQFNLHVHGVFGEDADEYTVRASNRAGTRSSHADLYIMSPPKLHVPPRFRDLATFGRGESCVIKIPFTGFPRPRMRWSKEGEEIEAGAHFELEVKERHALIVIKDASRLDDGPYRLYAENELGSDSAVIEIRISDRPDSPRLPLIEVVGDTYVNLSWQTPNWDGGSAITNYVIEKRTPGMDTWIRCASTRYLLHQVTGLNPQREYEFRVFAENIYGRSDPSDVSSLVSTKASDEAAASRGGGGEWSRLRAKTFSQTAPFDYDNLVSDSNRSLPVDIKVHSGAFEQQYELLEPLGHGPFGVVHRCKDRRTGQNFAVKFIPFANPAERSAIRHEIDLMNQLHHPGLLRIHDAFEQPDEMALVFELLGGPEILERAADDSYSMNEKLVADYIRQVSEALRHMHERNIVHLDLKPESIMFSRKQGGKAKIVDFGLACKLDPNQLVKISTGCAEFAAPEVLQQESVGFYTDMWALGVLAYTLLSGQSPFYDLEDSQMSLRIRSAQYDFTSSIFSGISDAAKNFISQLLVARKDKRMTVHDALSHEWLRLDASLSDRPISNSLYVGARDRMRNRYADSWWNATLSVGHLANYGALRLLRHSLHETMVDRRELAPRFVIRPVSTFVYEGQAAKFFCRVLSPAAPATASWHRDSAELKQSVKYMRRYAENEYTFVINRTRLQDRGEYIIRAENHYGYREEPVFLNVQPRPTQTSTTSLPEPRRSRREARPALWTDEPDSAPSFTFMLRPRLIQVGNGVKLLGCFKAKPAPEVQWFRNGNLLSKTDYTQTSKDGVVILEITSCSLEDAGKYTCRIANSLGECESTCVIIVDRK